MDWHQNHRGPRPFGRFLTVLLAFAIAVIGLPTLAIATAPPAEAATPGCSFAAGGGTGANHDRIC